MKPRQILYIVLAVLIVAFALIAFFFFRNRNQSNAPGQAIQTPVASMLITPKPTATSDPTPTPVPTPTPDPTPIIETSDPMPGDRGMIVACVQERLRALGYYLYQPTSYYMGVTQQSVKAFQNAHNLDADGVLGQSTLAMLFSASAKPASVAAPTPAGSPPPTVRPREYGTPIRWEQANAQAPVNSQFLVVDLTSQLYFTAVRTGGTTHMEIEPVNAEETARYLAIFSGAVSYEKRPCLIEYNGQIWAASLCGMPHGTATVAANNCSGTLCLYFFDSTGHDTVLPDIEHNANLLIASDGKQPQ